MRTFLMLAGALILLAACGTRGQLTLPPHPNDVGSKPAEAAQ